MIRLRPSALLLAATLAILSGGGLRAEDDLRFSRALASQEFSASGLGRLSSDQLAILDALVRRDVATVARSSRPPKAEHFSGRLSPDERRDAGIEQLAENERTALDAQVQRLIAPPVDIALASAGSSSPTNALRSVKIRRAPEIHGTVALMVAAGSHGYSAYGGGVAFTYDDPASKMSVTVAYSELHEKGRYLSRGCLDRYAPGWGPMLW